MRIHNLTPFPVGYITTSRRPPQPEMTVVVRGAFVLKPDHPVEPPEGMDLLVQGPLSSEVFAEGDDERRGECLYPSDFADFKLRTDVLLRGSCHPSGGNPVTECPVQFSVGTWSKTLRVAGLRAWSDSLSGAQMSDPLPFHRMPLDYAHAFGGPSYAKNPAGKGLDSNELPNVELAEQLIRSRDDRPEPAGFGPINPAWPQRSGKTGKAYGKSYLKQRAPWFAEDFDWSYFNAAPADQQLPGYLRGDEPIAFHNLHPSAPAFSTHLPGLRVRVFIKDRKGRFREVPMSLDTLLADLDRELLYLTWRGVEPVDEDDLTDVAWMVVASERLADPPREEGHYRAILEDFEKDPLRVDEHVPEELRDWAKAELYGTKQAPGATPPAASDGAPLDPISALMQQKLGSLAAKEQETLRKAIAAALERTPAEIEIPGQPAKQVDLLGAMTRAVNDVSGDAKSAPPAPKPKPQTTIREIKTKVAQLKKDAAEKGVKLEGLEQIESQLDDPRLAQFGAGDTPLVEPGPGVDLSGRDFSREDFSGRDLRGAILERAILLGANLRGANLEGARLKQAILAEADLSGANLAHADLTQVNGSHVRATGANFSDATLNQAAFNEADLGGATLAGATGEMIFFMKARLVRADVRGAVFTKAIWESADLEEADFSGARLTQCLMMNSRAPRAHFDRTMLTGTSFAGSDLTLATFIDARGEGTIWLGTTLDRTGYSYAILPGAFFFETKAARVRILRTDLKRARFYRASLEQAEIVQSSLFQANFNRTALAGAKVIGSSFFDATFIKTPLDECDMKDCNLKRILVDMEKHP